MKKIFITLLLLVPYYHNLAAQRTEPERFDNVLYLVTDSSDEWNLESFGNHLTAYGYVLENVNEKFHTLTTAEKTTAGGYKHKLNVSCKNQQIVIRVTCNLLMLGSTVGNYQQTWVDWDFRTSRGNILNKNYQVFYPVIAAFGETVYFERR